MIRRPLRIVHCMRAPVGGLFRHVCDLAEAQAQRGHSVGIIADAATGGDAAAIRFQTLARHCELGISRFAMSRLPGPGDLVVAARIVRLARQVKPDVLHGHGAKGGAYARIAGTWLRQGGLPVRAYTPHGGSLHYRRTSPAGFFYLATERLLARRTDVFLFESRYGDLTFRDKIGTPPGIVRVVYNGLAPSEFAPVAQEANATDFVFVGELRALKGVDLLLDALARLAAAGLPATATIVGAGADAESLRRMAARLGLSERVRFPGAMPARAAFAQGRCVVVPSRAESLPYVVLEAAAAAMPIVATTVGGIPEIFGNQAHRLVEPDNADALATEMGHFLANPAEARRQAEVLAVEIRRHFSADAMADGVLAAYEAALEAAES
ncbi:glycosyltransferase involved in cell wall biosynthesis [Tepidamorphus gemmatus]|uniref:Glycosyltransferase involved in cell wall biosynthesis n=1 Tax=Tepidamorphus gemmatus TaxID=747076 RepID=A0A4R3MCZ6_9HYPH|nr:glycosyltransferase family 4 protein [Tepidamorphus gemmatus]TCT11470.1 glycosyltransferase involved in cell wall biosynthesis [Tepidamorphus gemmatus]